MKSQLVLDELFAKGKSVSKNGFTLLYLTTTWQEKIPFKVGFSAPKKCFIKSPDRNLVKRRMREVFRKNKNLLEKLSPITKKKWALFFICKNKEVPTYEVVEKNLLALMVLLAKGQDLKTDK